VSCASGWSGSRSASGSAVPEWVYGVVDRDAPELGEEKGIDGAAVKLIGAGPLAALASTVPGERFGEDALKAALEDVERLEALARAHQDVIDRALARGVVVPFRLCTIYEDEGRVREMLEREPLEEALDRLRGTAEWGVKAYRADRDEAAAAPAARSGTEYLRRKRDERETAEAAREAVEERAATIHTQLAAHAREAALSRPHDRRLSGDEREMLLNGSYLVPLERVDGFREAVEALDRENAPHGVRLELTGPWAPYHFVAEAPA
jgi:Gas vesicle synthesis protein GvpL/GvpF